MKDGLQTSDELGGFHFFLIPLLPCARKICRCHSLPSVITPPNAKLELKSGLLFKDHKKSVYLALIYYFYQKNTLIEYR